MAPGGAMTIGVISDTHGFVDDDARRALAGVELILHAGDVGRMDVLTELQAIAPVSAVRGNTDHAPGVSDLPDERVVEVAGRRLLVGHIRGVLEGTHRAAEEGLAAVVFGHTHRPLIEWDHGVLWLNPGSAGRPRFGSPRTLARLHVGGDGLCPEIVVLGGDDGRGGRI